MWANKPSQPNPLAGPSFGAPLSSTEPIRPSSTTPRSNAWLGPSLDVKGRISGAEDLQIDGTVEGPISLKDHRLTVGRSAKLTSEIVAREIIVYGKVTGNLRARDRVEIKKDGSVIGDLATARIMIEDGAYFKGKIEIERAIAPEAANEPESLGVPAVAQAS